MVAGVFTLKHCRKRCPMNYGSHQGPPSRTLTTVGSLLLPFLRVPLRRRVPVRASSRGRVGYWGGRVVRVREATRGLERCVLLPLLRLG